MAKTPRLQFEQFHNRKSKILDKAFYHDEDVLSVAQNLLGKVEEQNKLIGALTSKADSANTQVKDIALKAIARAK